MKILFAASECVPFIKTGGLGDVIGSLPVAISEALTRPTKKLKSLSRKKSQSKIHVVLPKYAAIDIKTHSFKKLPGKLRIPIGDRVEEGIVWKCSKKGGSSKVPVEYFLIENKKYFDRDGLYQSNHKDFADNDERFTFFSRAVLELCKLTQFVPDIIHCHDWQTGLIPAYLKTLYHVDAFFNRTSTIFTVHNIAYQGVFPKTSLFVTGIGWSDFTSEKLEYYGQLSFLKSGLVYSDSITTVSPSYSREVRENSDYGCGMQATLRKRSKDFTGILNGLDYSEWDPSTDSHLVTKYKPNSRDLKKRKNKCKGFIQKEMGLPQSTNVPLMGMVSRLDFQKGFKNIIELLKRGTKKKFNNQWIFLGTGDPKISHELKLLAKQNPGTIAFSDSFSHALSHQIYAGSDLFLMPSDFEPCGLGQLIAMKYGTIPIVTPTGGLKDTVLDWKKNQQKGTGFITHDKSVPSLERTIGEALNLYSNPNQWELIVKNAMLSDFSWKTSALEYVQLYQNLILEQ